MYFICVLIVCRFSSTWRVNFAWSLEVEASKRCIGTTFVLQICFLGFHIWWLCPILVNCWHFERNFLSVWSIAAQDQQLCVQTLETVGFRKRLIGGPIEWHLKKSKALQNGIPMQARAPFWHLGLLRNHISRPDVPLTNETRPKSEPSNRPPFYVPPPDVVTRRAERADLKANLKALDQYMSNSGQALRPGAHETSILAQDYILVHRWKGVLYVYIYTHIHACSTCIYIDIHTLCHIYIYTKRDAHVYAVYHIS